MQENKTLIRRFRNWLHDTEQKEDAHVREIWDAAQEKENNAALKKESEDEQIRGALFRILSSDDGVRLFRFIVAISGYKRVDDALVTEALISNNARRRLYYELRCLMTPDHINLIEKEI